jgi:heterotetrameric sarcosine oxidase delta subunit
MKTINCPLLGWRPVSEFTAAGVLEPEPADLGEMSAAQWVFERNNVPMRRTEWWYHGATQLWFKVLRDTATDTIIDVTTARD